MNQRIVTLLTALTFIVLVVTGVLAFVLAFSMEIVGLHALMGFVFIVLAAFHVSNNFRPMMKHLRSRMLWVTLPITAVLTFVFWQQPLPVKSLLGLSGNLGPAIDRFKITEKGMIYQYAPDGHYKMILKVRTGTSFDADTPPCFAIWLENASLYHIKTLHAPMSMDDVSNTLPYWAFKRRGWEKAKRDAESSGKDLVEELGIDGLSGATQNSSFDPADYILPKNTEKSLPYRLLIEIDQPDDKQASLVYAVDIDNADPRTFQLLDLIGYPKHEQDDDNGKERWQLYYVDESFDSALDLIDSALLTIERYQ